MKLNKVIVSTKRTVQMRQFEPAEISIMLEAQIDPGENAETVIRNVKKICRDHVEQEADRLKTKRIESIDDEKEKSI